MTMNKPSEQKTDDPVTVPGHIERFERLAFGLFIHYGLYALLGRGEWAISHDSIPSEEYATLTQRFTADEFDGRAIAKLAAESGMRYAVLTARHHDGFSLYDTRGLNEFDAPHSAAGRDLVADFVSGCRDAGVVPFLYHTTLDWKQDSMNPDDDHFNRYLDYLIASVEILCTHYGQIGGFWFDGNWSREGADWREDEMYGMIRRLQPEAMIVNNSGLHAQGSKTHPQLDAVTYERGRPRRQTGQVDERYVAGEMCQTTTMHWGHAADDFQHVSPASIIEDLCACRGAGANLLLNVGPEPSGRVSALDQAVLRRVGQWVDNYADLLRDGRATDARCPGEDFVLEYRDKLYYFAHNLPCRGDANVQISGQSSDLQRTVENLDHPVTGAHWLDGGQPLDVTTDTDGRITLSLTGFPYGRNLVVRVAELLTAS